MEMIKVGICLDDMHFAHALSRGLARECRNMTFFLLDQIEDGAGCDLILSSSSSEDHRRILMVRDVDDENIYGEPPYRVYRYRESHRMVNDLLFIYFKITGKNLEFTGDAKCKLLVFASISGGCGCTALSISVGKMLYALYGCKCLYLNLCPIDDSKKYLPTGSKQGLLSLLYYLDNQRDFPLRSFIMSLQHIDSIQTNLLNSYFDEVSLKLLDRLIKKVDELGEYTFLICDISNHFSRTNKQLLSRASQMVLLYQEKDQIQEGYFASMMSQLEQLSKGVNLLKVKNFVEDDQPEDKLNLCISKVKDHVYVNEDGLLDLTSVGQFQSEAATIAREIMEEKGL